MKHAIFFLLLLFPFFGQSQTVDEVIDNYIKAIGGQNRIDSLRTMKSVSSYVNHHADTTIITDYIIRNRAQRTEVVVKKAKMVISHNDTIAWSADITPFGTTYKKLDSTQLAIMKPDDNIFLGLVNYKMYGLVAKLIGTSQLNSPDNINYDTYKIGLAYENKLIGYYYIDKNSWLLVKTESWQDQTWYSDYKTFGGLKFPCRMIYSISETTQTTTYFSYEINIEINEGIFLKP